MLMVSSHIFLSVYVYAESSPGSIQNEELIVINDDVDDVDQPAAKRQRLDNEYVETEPEILEECNSGVEGNAEIENKEKSAIEDTEEMSKETETGGNEGISEMIEKLKEILQSGEEEGFTELLSEVSKLSVADIEWFCRRIDFAKMTDDSTDVVCKNMCHLSELLSYQCVVCLLQYVIFEKVQQLSQTPSRKLSGAITVVAGQFPKQLIDSVLVPCAAQEDVSSFQTELLCRLVKDELTLNTRSYFVKKLFTSKLTMNESKLPLMQSVFENSFDAEENVVSHIINTFDTVSNDFVKNLKFGKLLLAVVTKHGVLLNEESKLRFSAIVDKHGTFLKKSIKNALSKLK